MKIYGLIGNPVEHSFSEKYFANKFRKENIDAIYKSFKLDDISQFQDLIQQEKHLSGLNVTIPYKEKIIPLLDDIDKQAENIGAVNTIDFRNGKRTGYNTDSFGFMKSLFPLLENHHDQALILGTGGAAKAVAQALRSLGIMYKMVSRSPSENNLAYHDLTKDLVSEYHLIVNCTPLGTYPNIKESPNIPYEGLSEVHLLYDLTYNPAMTQFLAKGQKQGCKILNGQKMLEFQADRSWQIWTQK